MDAKLITTSECHFQANDQVKKFNSNLLVARLRHFIGKHQIHWDSNVQPLDYGYSTQAHRTKKRPLLA